MGTETSSSRKRYEVFLSFRGTDTRTGFTDHLYKALNDDKGIYTFRDDKKLERGKDVAPELLEAIEESRFAIVVFSKDYASSTWCLIELAKIVECKENLGLTVLPIFYHVEPTDVRKQKGEFGEAFAKHGPASEEDIEKVNKWREALTEVASISGWHIKEKDGRPETEDLKEILQVVLKELNKVSISNNDLVGMVSRIKEMYLVLKISRLEEIRQLKDVCTVGIWGMGGIGKTTLAEEVKKNISNGFEACGFVANVREEFEKNGIVHLQNRLYKFLLNEEGKIQNVEMGKNVLRNRLCSRRVLIILDDVDEVEQIEDLVGNAEEQHEWLGPGSRVIVTTRNKDLLKTYGENNIYKVDKLNEEEALHLISRKAFKKSHPLHDFVDLSKNFVTYADHHPFAIKVLGSFLYGRKMDEWIETLEKLIKGNPEETILKVFRVLQVSYDGLDGDKQKIFLDVACFFKGWDAYRVKKIFEGCGLHPTIDIQVLIEKSLIYTERGRLWMHDLLQQLGQDIVRRESLEEPGKRSRIWSHEDARNVLVNSTGTEDVRGIFLCLPETEVLLLEFDSIFNMKKLRFLKLRNVDYPKRVGYLSNELRLLEWHGYPLTSMPPNFHPNNLVQLDMSNSRIQQLWKSTKHDLRWLISIDLSNCEHLTQAPDFSRVPNLERLILEGCKRLSKVDPAIGDLKRLVLLNLKGCESLKSLSQVINLISLETLILSGCTKLIKFPDIEENMDHLSELYLDGTAIKELPISIERLTGLILLDLRECKNLLKLPDVLCNLTSLKALKISGCSKLDQLPENIGSLKQLEEFDASRTAIRKVPSSITLLKNIRSLCFEECGGVAYKSWKSLFGCFLLPVEESISFQLPNSLSLVSLTSLCLRKCKLTREAFPEDIFLPSLGKLDLSENNFVSLPDSISQLSNLTELHLDHCRKLKSLPKLPLGIKNVYARGCRISDNSNDQLIIWTSDRGFTFIHCENSEETSYNQVPVNLVFSLFGEQMGDLFCKNLMDVIFNALDVLILKSTCTIIPEWCSHQNDGSSMGIRLPVEDNDETWIGLALFFHFVIQEDGNFHEDRNSEYALFRFGTDKGCHWSRLICMDHLRKSVIPSYVVCIYIPRKRFKEQLNKASQIRASVSSNKSYRKANMCGMQVVFNKDLLEFSRKLTDQTILGHFDKYELIKEVKLEPSSSAGALEIQPNPHKRIKQEDCRSTESDLMRKARKDLQWLVHMLVERCNALKYGFLFQFDLKAIPSWFFHQSVAPFVVCYLPRNLLTEKPCTRLCLYASLTRHPSDSEIPAFLHIVLRFYGENAIIRRNLPIEHELVVLSEPLAHFIAQLNQCRIVSVSFNTSIQDWKVEMCGVGLLYEEDLENVVEMITDLTLRGDNFFYEEGSSAIELDLGMNVEIPFDLHNAGREKKSLQELLPNTQPVKNLSVFLKQNIRRCCSESSYQVIPESTLKDTRPSFINLQIMAENAFYVNDFTKWQKGLEDLLEQLFGFDIFIALILDKHIISVVKPFNPLLSYNLIFPRKEILDWFGADFHTSMRSTKIELPPNLNSDKNWRGLAVCAALSVHEHPTAILDGLTSRIPFGLQCHLETEEHCFQIPLFGVAKDKLTWLYLRGFIWLTYIPSSVLKEWKIEQNYLEIRTTSSLFSGVVTKNISARLLYQQDVEEFAQSIAKCTVSFFDNLDLIRKAMANDEDGSCDCLFHFHAGCSLHHLEEIATYCGVEAKEDKNPSHSVKTETCEDGNSNVVTRQENLTEPIYPRKIGLDFDRGMIYSSCFPPTEILDWFSQHNGNGPSLTIQLPSNPCSVDNWIGLALCAYFSDPVHPTTFLDKFDPDFTHYLVCHLETERVILDPLHHHGMTSEEFKKLGSGEFIWLSYIPRLWFSDQLKDCNLIEASFASERGGWRAQKCGLRLLYLHEEEEFKKTINHCMALFIDNQDPISHAQVDNERNKKQPHDGGAGSSKSSIFVPDSQQETLEGHENLNQKDKAISQGISAGDVKKPVDAGQVDDEYEEAISQGINAGDVKKLQDAGQLDREYEEAICERLDFSFVFEFLCFLHLTFCWIQNVFSFCLCIDVEFKQIIAYLF